MYGGDEHMFVMLLTEKKFQTFTPKQICDAGKYTEVLVCLSLESRAKVDQSNGCEGDHRRRLNLQ
jgi:predicted lactoylglutathione lyase